MEGNNKKSIDIMDAYEIDVDSIKKNRSNSDILKVKCLSDVLAQFGYDQDDRIDRQESCTIYEKARNELENEIYHLAHSNSYEKAKEMRQVLIKIRQEFDSLQTTSIKLSQLEQIKQFNIACNDLESKLNNSLIEEKKNINQMCNELTIELNKQHQIQKENLELEIMRIPKPRMKYCKRTLELLHAEDELIKLNQYDDARKVRSMLDKILPNEIKKYYATHDNAINNKRNQLHMNQQNDILKLEEKIKNIKYIDIRRREKEKNVFNTRINNHNIDMTHSFLLENKIKPEVTIKPSALWYKRTNYHTTSSSLRGEQLLDVARGKGTDKKVFAVSLVDRHDFDDILTDTVCYK